MRVPDASIAAKYLINTHMMVKVVEFHPETQTVDVVQEVYDYINTTSGQYVVQNEFGEDVVAGIKVLDVLYDIPVKQMRYGQFQIQVCPKPGDTGYLEIFTEDLQNWVDNGGPCLANSAIRFMRKSSVFVPFVPNKTNCAEDYPLTNESFVIKSEHTTISITDPEEEEGEEQYGESIDISMRNGVSVKISADGSVSINCQNTTITATDSVTIDTPSTKITGTLDVDGAVTTGSTLTTGGDITSGGDVTTSGGISLDNHTHPVTTATSIVATGVNPTTPAITAETDAPTA